MQSRSLVRLPGRVHQQARHIALRGKFDEAALVRQLAPLVGWYIVRQRHHEDRWRPAPDVARKEAHTTRGLQGIFAAAKHLIPLPLLGHCEKALGDMQPPLKELGIDLLAKTRVLAPTIVRLHQHQFLRNVHVVGDVGGLSGGIAQALADARKTWRLPPSRGVNDPEFVLQGLGQGLIWGVKGASSQVLELRMKRMRSHQTWSFIRVT